MIKIVCWIIGHYPVLLHCPADNKMRTACLRCKGEMEW